MDKNDELEIKKILEENGLSLSFNTTTETAYLGKKKLNTANFRLSPIYDGLKKHFYALNESGIIRQLIEYSKKFSFEDTNIVAQRERTDEKNMEEWEKMLIRDKQGYIDRFQKRNMYIFFKYFPKFDGKFKYNSFNTLATYDGEIIEDHITERLSMVAEQMIGNNNSGWVNSLTNVICHENSYNPLIDALDKLPEWDGVKRMETYLIDYIGAYDNKLNREMTKKFFYAMFERLFHPGCRFDHMLITYDERHGTGKTTIVIVLLEALMEFAGNSIEDSGIIALNDLGFDKDTVQCLNKAWIAYVDELAKFLKEEPEDVKKFITLTTDNARLSYAKLNKNFPRHCVFYGSTNTREFIKDNTDTYERRFWVVDCEGERHEDKDYWDKVLPMETKLQIMAEIYKFWKDNPNYSYNELEEDDIEALKEVQRAHTTASKDIILGQKIMTILDFDYSKPDDYKNYYEWANEAKSKWDSYKGGISTTEITEQETYFFGQKEEDTTKKKLDRIPIIWLTQFVQEELGRMISDYNYIGRLIYLRWRKNSNAYYNGYRGCFIRLK